MYQFIQKAIRGQMGAYLQALAVLLMVSAAVYVVVFTTGCYEPAVTSTITSWESRRRTGSRPDFRVRLQANARQAQPGERATRTLGGQGDPGTTQVSYRWTPPWGATNLSFDPPPDPGSPPYIWSNRSPTEEINISYNQPTLPPGESTMLATDTALAEWDGQSSATSYTALITNEASQGTASRPIPPASQESPAGINAAAATTDMWQVERWFDPRGITMTTKVCQDWFDFLGSDEAFLAVRVPVSPTVAITESYPLPIVFGGLYSNTLQLISYSPFGPVITATMELRPERFTFLENALPAAPGEHWLALGVVSDAVTCPPGLELAADMWSFLSKNYLDLSHQPDNCEGCVLPSYYCYEGQDAPPVSSSPGSALMLKFVQLFGSSFSVTSYQGEGITCLGPQPLTIQDEAEWGLGGASSVWITPTLPITLHHYIRLDFGSDPMTFTLDYTATLGVGWSIYGGDWSGPDLGDPVTPPIPVTWQETQHLWMVSDPAPTDTDAGPYTLIVTATSVVSPADSLWASDVIWVGEWVAPPTPPLEKQYIYLPLVTK